MAVARTGAEFRKVELSADQVHSSLAAHVLADGYPFVYDHRRSTGSELVDAVTGRKYLDLFSFFASSPLSHNHPKMTTPDFLEKIARVAITKPSNPDVYTIEMAEAVETFARYVFPDSLPHLFFISGGTLAVENALKVAFDWKVRKNLARGLGEKGTRVLHFREAFHGRSGYTLSLTNTADPRKYMYFPKFDWPRVLNPKVTFPLDDESLAAVEDAERQSLSQIEEAFDRYPDDIAAIIIEPIQCEGGDNYFRPEFLRELRRIADEREALLVFDEIQSGMGVTGRWWAFEHYGVEPDVIAFGKKSQVCGVAAGRRVDEVEHNVFAEGSRINSTWGGNLVDYVRGQRYVEIILEDDLLGNTAVQGQYFLSGLRDLESAGAAISNVRGLGLLVALDLETREARDKVLADALDRGLLILGCGERSIRFRPHLDVTRDTLDRALDILEDVLPRREA